MDWLLLALYILLALAGLAILVVGGFFVWILKNYLGVVSRIFEEKPLFNIPRGQPMAGSEEVTFPTTDGLTLAGSYLRALRSVRHGVILFGPEFGSHRWSCSQYCKALLESGFDVFTFDFRNHGDSEVESSYEPLQWVTDREMRDMQAAVAYLKGRSDADRRGIGIFGISRGGGAAILTAAHDPWVRCVATDGAFATCTTMVAYMQKWVSIYSQRLRLKEWLPRIFYSSVALITLRHVGKRRGCQYLSLERAIPRLSPRPILMIHGGLDTYIKPEIAEELFELARPPKEFWVVEGAKHNQALHRAPDEYQKRLLGFFGKHLAGAPIAPPQAQLAVTP